MDRKVAIFEDKTARLPFNNVRYRTDFIPSYSENYQFGYASSAYWFRFEVTNRSQENVKHWLLAQTIVIYNWLDACTGLGKDNTPPRLNEPVRSQTA